MIWNKKNDLGVMREEFQRELDKLILQVSDLRASVMSLKSSLGEAELNRLADLEIKMAKLWAMITTTTPAGQEKLNRTGKKIFGGLSTNRN